jgi:beta-lactamase class A
MFFKRRNFIIAAIIAVAVFAAVLASIPLRRYQEHQQLLRRRTAAWLALEAAVKSEIQGFDEEVGVVIEDLPYHLRLSVNDKLLMPSASLVKIPVMASCFYAIREQKMKLDQFLILREKEKVSGSGSIQYLPAGTYFSIDELIRRMISESDNTAANMLINYLGFDYINGTFKRMGMQDTQIVRLMMDFKSRSAGRENYTTASDIAHILRALYGGSLISAESDALCLEYLKQQKHRDRIPAKLPSATTVAHKTGLENGVCHDAGIVFTPQGDYLICVLVRHNNQNARPAKKFIGQLAFMVYEYFLQN